MIRNKTMRILFSFALIGVISACTPTVHQRGNLVENTKVEQIVPGTHMRSDVLKIMGSPTTQSTFDPDIWYYIGQETEKRGVLDAKVKKERILEIQFDKETGVVHSVKDVGEGRLDIPVSREETKTHGNDTHWMKEFFGNLGKFNPQQ
jgi:outer membrane protein assembly factor BamE (lipoprotein component of BamABCDE complex)